MMSPGDKLERMIAWEEGTLEAEDTIELFQELVNTGEAWTLQGTYGREAQWLTDAGYVVPPSNEPFENDGDPLEW